MDSVKSMLILGKVLESGSMATAARELGMTSSAVSQHIRSLEQEFKVRLLNRTTRRLSPTTEGMILWQGAKQIAQTLEQTKLALAQLQTEFSGKVTLSLPTGFIDSFAVNNFVAKVKELYPYIQLELIPDDQLIDLMNSPIDIAIRAAEPEENSQLIARYLSQWHLCICASSSYLQQHKINSINDLASQSWINYNDKVLRNTLSSLGLGHIELQNPLLCSSILAARSLTIAGLGLTLQLSGEVERFLHNNEIVRVLPELAMPTYNIYAVTAHRVQSAKIEAILRLLKECFAERGRE